MRIVMLIVVAAPVLVALADERPRLRDRETPRATELLQAQKMAQRAQSRLRMPAARAEWKHGGDGWERAPEPPAPPSGVTVEIRGPRRQRTRP